MDYVNPHSRVTTDWLATHIEAPDLRPVDASWYLPQEKRHAKSEFTACHIPGAVFFDVDEIADTDSPLPHMLPSPEKFSSRMRRLGLGDGNRIVVYDGAGMMSAARVWWMFKVFGHDDVAILDGGLPKWLADGHPTSDAPILPRERHFHARKNNLMVRDFDQMLANLRVAREQVVDARGPGRFSGADPEPRQGLRSGHIPDSVNLPFVRLLDGDDATMLPAEALRKAFGDAGIDLDRPVTCTCGSGVSACVLAFALHLLGHRDVAVYDGSWSDWGSRADAPMAD